MELDTKLDMNQGECSTSGTVDVDQIVRSVRKRLDHYRSQDDIRHKERNLLCIIKEVSKHIREVDSNSYEPIIVSIGPKHYGKPALQAMEREKWDCLDYILKLNPGQKLYDYLHGLEEVGAQAKLYYLEGIDMDCQDFLRMMLLDGCFILVSLCVLADVPHKRDEQGVDKQDSVEVIVSGVKNAYSNAKSIENTRSDYVGSMNDFVPTTELMPVRTSEQCGLGNFNEEHTDQHPDASDQIGKWHDSFMKHDLFLVENQIPFVIIWRIYEQFAGKGKLSSLTENFCEFVENILHQYPLGIKEYNRPKEFHHLLHLFHIYLRPSKKTEHENGCVLRPQFFDHLLYIGQTYLRLPHHPEKNKGNLPRNRSKCFKDVKCLLRWRQAVQYHEAGVVFRKKEFRKSDPHSLLDISFNHGVLEIPCLVIDQNTAVLFRNLIAMENTCPAFGNDFTAYIAFLSQAMCSHNDVTLLSQKGIVVHQMRTDEEVSILFGKIGKNVDFDPNGRYYLKYICEALEEHYRSRLNRWMAWLWQNHFSNPWLSLAVVAGAIVLLCTILQTWFAFLAYVKPVGQDTTQSLS